MLVDGAQALSVRWMTTTMAVLLYEILLYFSRRFASTLVVLPNAMVC